MIYNQLLIDTIDNAVLISCLKHCVWAFRKHALKWFQSYFDNVSVSFGEFTTGAASLTRDVPQHLFSCICLILGQFLRNTVPLFIVMLITPKFVCP